MVGGLHQGACAECYRSRMDEPLAQGTRLGPYEIREQIGAGGMGQVYRALDPRLGRSVAIKTLARAIAADPQALRRFETEARAAGTLDHPNLLVVYDVGHEGPVAYLVSELLEGETLHQRLQRGPLPVRQAIEVAVQVARGLAAAHARGVVHRDLKPANVFLTRDRRVKILDFGIAKLVGASDGASTAPVARTSAGLMVGTAEYMAPEQIRGAAVDARTDLFALGLLLHEMLTGTHPFRRGSVPETLAAILNDDAPELPAAVGAALRGIVRRCLEKSPEDRFHSAHDVALALELVAGGESTTAAHAVEDEAASPPRRRALALGASALGLAAAAAVGGAWLGRGRTGPVVATPSFQRLTFRRGLVRSARIAPDGQTILYGALWDGDACRVYTTRLDNPESRALDLPQANVLAVSRTGELALSLGVNLEGVFTYGTLARVPIAGGAPRELVEDVKFADWSPDGSALALIRSVDGVDRLEYPQGRVLVQPGEGEGTGLGFARVAPDGQRVAYIHYADPQALFGTVRIVDAQGRIEVLTGEFVNIHGLAWSGERLWFTASDDRPLFRSLRVIEPGRAPRVVARMPVNVTVWDASADGRLLIAQTDDRAAMIGRLPGDENDRDLSWLDASWVADVSRDGRMLLFSELGQGVGAVPAAYLRGTDGSPAVRLGTGQPLALSADGQWALVMNSERPLARAAPHIDLVPTGPGETRRLPDVLDLDYYDAWWPPGSQRVVVLAAATGQAPQLYRMELPEGETTPLTPEGIRRAVMAPDGLRMAARHNDGRTIIYPVAGGEPTAVAALDGSDMVVGWINAGLLFLRTGDPTLPRGQLHLLDPATGRSRPWANILPRDAAGIMVLGTFRVTPDGGARIYTWHRALSHLYLAEGLA